MPLQSFVLYSAIGILAGILSGMFGIGGGLVIIPALIYVGGYSQLSATGTSLAVLLPPIGVFATMEYYRRGYVNIKAAMVIALFLLLASWLGARFTRKINEFYLRIGFGGMLTIVGLLIVISSLRKIKG